MQAKRAGTLQPGIELGRAGDVDGEVERAAAHDVEGGNAAGACGELAATLGERAGNVALPAVLDDGDAVLSRRHAGGDGLRAGVAVGAQHEDGARLAQAHDADRPDDAALQRPHRLGNARRRPARLQVRQQHAEGEAEKEREADDARYEPGGGEPRARGERGEREQRGDEQRRRARRRRSAAHRRHRARRQTAPPWPGATSHAGSRSM